MTAQTVELIDSMGTDLTPVNAARVSFNKESDWVVEGPEHDITVRLADKDSKLIKYLADNKHTSCFEHQTATFRLKVPIFVARQIQRHRTFAYNEVSRRYVKDELEFYWPDKWRKAAENVKQGSSDEEVKILSNQDPIDERTFDAIEYCRQVYEHLLESGVAAEQARMILPQNLMTQFYMTGNLRNWAHFLELRLDSHAQAEVRDVAVLLEKELRTLWPVSMKALLNGS